MDFKQKVKAKCRRCGSIYLGVDCESHVASHIYRKHTRKKFDHRLWGYVLLFI